MTLPAPRKRCSRPAVPQVSLKHCPGPEGPAAELPSASTCFHTLKLPPYESEAELAERLRYAVANSRDLIDLS